MIRPSLLITVKLYFFFYEKSISVLRQHRVRITERIGQKYRLMSVGIFLRQLVCLIYRADFLRFRDRRSA